ncbi:hypothetical protein G6F57_017882 [Rhizopus arrhizus]|nr:hypothetical protein G6F57_017882 [Rhizopus arrhizus]
MHFTGTTVLKVIDGKIVEERGLDDGGAIVAASCTLAFRWPRRPGLHPRSYCTGARFAALAAAAYIGISRAMVSARACGELPPGSMPSSSKRSATAGSRTATDTAACSVSMTAGGVPAGAYKDDQNDIAKPGAPDSATVGTSGNKVKRFAPVTASAFSRPLRIWGSTAAVSISAKSISLANNAATTLPFPL